MDNKNQKYIIIGIGCAIVSVVTIYFITNSGKKASKYENKRSSNPKMATSVNEKEIIKSLIASNMLIDHCFI